MLSHVSQALPLFYSRITFYFSLCYKWGITDFFKIMYIGRFHDLGILFQERKGGTGSDTLL